MNIIINQNNLMGALRATERMISRNISLPILNTVLLKTENGQLKISATNLEMGINYWISAKVNKDGEIAVPARIFSDLIANISDEKINLSTEKNTVLINSSNYQSKILSFETKEFPIIPRAKGADSKVAISPELLKRALLGVADSAATSETRPELAGVFVNFSGNQAEFAATDGFRLAEIGLEVKGDIQKKIIIPRAATLELIRLCDMAGAEIILEVADSQVFIKGENFEYVSRLIDGHYPEYKKIIPEKYISSVRVKREELERNIRMASIFSSNISDIKIIAETDKLSLQAQNSDRGQITNTTQCVLKNEPFSTSVNFRYLLDGLKTISGEYALIQFTGEGSPLLIKPEDGKNQIYLIMPLRT